MAEEKTKKNYVFLHNPKTGGETIDILLDLQKDHRKAYERKKEINQNYSFVFVRHPVTRLVSWYYHLLKHRYIDQIENNQLNNKSLSYNILKKGGKKNKMGPNFHRILAENKNLNDWIQIMIKNSDKYSKRNDGAGGPLSFQYSYV